MGMLMTNKTVEISVRFSLLSFSRVQTLLSIVFFACVLCVCLESLSTLLLHTTEQIAEIRSFSHVV